MVKFIFNDNIKFIKLLYNYFKIYKLIYLRLIKKIIKKLYKN